MKKYIMILLTLSLSGLSAQELSQVAEVNSGGLRLRTGPGISSGIIETFESGTKLLVSDEPTRPEVIDGYHGNWVKVSTANGLAGWTYDQWLDIHSPGEYYIPAENFTTTNDIAMSTIKVVEFGHAIYQIAFIVDEEGNTKLFLGKYEQDTLTDYTVFEIEGLKNYNIYTLYDYDGYVDFALIDDNDYVVSCRIGESLCVFRVKNDRVVWTSAFDLETHMCSPKMAVNGNNDIYIVNENSANFNKTNYDLTIRKLDIDGQLRNEIILATEKWDNNISVNCIEDHVYLSGDYNGLKNPGIIKLDSNLNYVDSIQIETDSDSYITNVVDDGQDLYLTMIVSGTRGGINRPVMIVSVNSLLEVNWAKSILGDRYTVEAGLRCSEDGVYVLTSTKEKYLYGRDSDDKRFSIVEFDSHGEYLSEGHFLLPISSILADFVSNHNGIRIWGKTPIYNRDVQGNVIRELAKNYFTAAYDREQIANHHLRNTIADTQITLYGEINTQIYAQNSDRKSYHIGIAQEEIDFVSRYPWDPEMIRKALYFEESER